MSITTDLKVALLAVEIAAQTEALPDWLRARLLAAVAALDDCAERVALVERREVPAHWRKQRWPTQEDLAGNVVALDYRRKA